MHLLALVASGLGARELDDYDPPATRVAEWLAEAKVSPADARRARIIELAEATGGEVS